MEEISPVPEATPPVVIGQPAVILVGRPTNPIGTAAGVLGIVGMALIWVPFVGGLLCLLSTILGGVGISKGAKESLPKGMAVTGLVLGLVGIAVYIVVTVLLAAASSLPPSLA